MKSATTKEMKKIFIFFVLFIFSIFNAQNYGCKLKVNADTSKINEKGDIFLTIENIGNKKTKILKNFDTFKMQMINAFIIIDKNGEHTPLNFNYADIDFFERPKMKVLRPHKSKIYKINIFETYQGKNLLSTNDYKFDLTFDLSDFYECETIGMLGLKDVQYNPK